LSTLAADLAQAARVVARVAAGTSLADVFDPRPAIIDLTHGTLRRYGRVQAIVRELSHRGRGDALAEALLWCALYALESGRYADYAVVDQTVRACTLLERWSAKGYVNALLRAFLRMRAALESRMQADPEARHQHPRWWIELLERAYPNEWSAILAAGNSHPPMCLRVNQRRCEALQYLTRLQASGIGARSLGGPALLLETPVPTERLPGYVEGEVSVQDAGAQRAAECIDLRAGQRVLDACAAPGGKAGHLLEQADIELSALEADAARCARLRANLARLGLHAQVKHADCTRIDDWWDGQAFDRVLADVPCTASGITRRHPDIKWLRRASDLDQFAARQALILDALWRVLRPGGKLLYATCSVFPQENDVVIDAFVGRAPGARRVALPDGAAAQGLPDAERDGFYYALIEKQT
jgi:16S rRNA (cytosine967-C5)-methyltransferase